MKVLAVLNFKKYVVLDVPEALEQRFLAEERVDHRIPDWNARGELIKMADEAASDADLEWTWSDYFKEDAEGGQEEKGIKFADEEWFDV